MNGAADPSYEMLMLACAGGHATAFEPPYAGLPVDSDPRLPPVDRVERVRQRRDAGDLDSARAGLAWLRIDHPQLPPPEERRAIMAPAPPDR